MVDDLDALGLSHHVLFLEAGEQALVTRYQETRRRHPLAPDGSVAAGVASERSLLAHFGSPEAVVAASREELQAVPGLPPKVARELHGHLHRAG